MSPSNPLALEPDLREVAQHLLVTCRITAEDDPDLYRAAVQGRSVLSEFFRASCEWSLEVSEAAEIVRLHKRRDDVPGDRGPLVSRGDRQVLAGREVLVLAMLVCEQLWRRPRMTLRELMQSIAQVCAAESSTARLPAFRVVSVDGKNKSEAAHSRQNLLDALHILASKSLLSVDADLERVRSDENVDVVISANRDRLAIEIASLSPTLLGLESRPAREHARALSASTLLDAASDGDETSAGFTAPSAAGAQSSPTDSEGARKRRARDALRRVLDDPGVDPASGTSEAVMPYLQTLTGRERALTAAASLGLAATVRRDWWQITDPSGKVSADNFPLGRRAERQASLALLAWLSKVPDEATETVPGERIVTEAEIVSVFEGVRERLPRWARSYQRSLPLLARAAAGQLVTAGLLVPEQSTQDSTAPVDPDLGSTSVERARGTSRRWRCTPGVHLWRVRLAYAEPVVRVPTEGTTNVDEREAPVAEPMVSGQNPSPTPLFDNLHEVQDSLFDSGGSPEETTQ